MNSNKAYASSSSARDMTQKIAQTAVADVKHRNCVFVFQNRSSCSVEEK
jgi:hypothetical protein